MKYISHKMSPMTRVALIDLTRVVKFVDTSYNFSRLQIFTPPNVVASNSISIHFKLFTLMSVRDLKKMIML